MAGRPPPLAAAGQGPFRGSLPSSNNENEEIWEVNLNMFERPHPGNRKELGNNRKAMALFNKPGTPKKQVRVAANWWAPAAPNAANPAAGQPWRVRPNVYHTPQRPVRKQIPKTPKKNNGSRHRKSRRNTRRLRK